MRTGWGSSASLISRGPSGDMRMSLRAMRIPGGSFFRRQGLTGSSADIPRLYIFWPDGDVDDYGSEDVRNCSFGRHLEARGDARTYDIVRGGQAFYHKILTDLREWNVSADICQNLEETAKEE